MAKELSTVPVCGSTESPVSRRPAPLFWDLPWAKLALAFLLLAASGASLSVFGFSVWVPGRAEFFAENELPALYRVRLWAAFLVGLGVSVGLPAGWLLVTRGRAAAKLLRLADIVCPLIVAALLPSLFSHQFSASKPLVHLLELVAVVLLTEQLVTRSLTALPCVFRLGAPLAVMKSSAKRWAPLLIVSLASLGYCVYFSHYTLLNHRRFGTAAFDLGINVNWCFNAMHGDLFRSTVLFGPDGGNFLSGHAIFAMFLWLPLYALSPGPEVLLVYQSVMCGLAAIPLFLFAQRLLPATLAVLIAVGYLLFAPLHGPNFYDYHELLVALPFHFLLYLFLAKGRYAWAALMVMVLYAHREDMSVGLSVLGLFLVLSGLRPRFGMILSATSIVAFILIKFVLMPSLGAWWFSGIYKDLQPKGSSGYGPVVQTILINPAYFLGTLFTQQKLIYFLHLLAPLVLLPLRTPLLALLALPGFFFTLMTTGYEPTLSIAFQYTTHWIPYLFLACVLSLKLLRDAAGSCRQWGAAVALGLGVLAHSSLFGAVLQRDHFVGGFTRIVFEESAKDRRHYAAFSELAELIPPEASVAATEREVPHVAARKDVYTLRLNHGQADYLLVRASDARGTVLNTLLQEQEYSLVAESERTFYLFKQGPQTPETVRAWRTLGIVPHAEKP